MQLEGAVLDPTRTYRYRLDRVVGPEGRVCLFVMLNPSTADENNDDPTIRRCIAFARREGCGRLVVCNLYAYRATDPATLDEVADPCGPDNDAHLMRAAKEADLAVLAWGARHLRDEQPQRVTTLVAALAPTFVFGWTANGDPRHPLYLRKDAPLVPWPRTQSPSGELPTRGS